MDLPFSGNTMDAAVRGLRLAARSSAADSRRFGFWKRLGAVTVIALLTVGASAETVDQLLQRGAALQQRGDSDGAIAAFRAAVSSEPRRLDAVMQLSILYLRTGQIQEAVASLQRAKELAPQHPGVAYFLGLAYSQADRCGEAREELDLILRQQPSNVQALHLSGDCLLRQGLLEEGIGALERVLQASPDVRQALYTLGSAYLKVGNVQAARELVRTRMEGDETPEALLIKGSLHLAEKRYGVALALLERARSANPQLPMANSQIGVALLYEGRRALAAEAFRVELAINPRDFNSNAFLGWLLEQEGDSERAIELLQAAHGLQESDAGVKYLLAQSHATQRNWQEVATLLEDVTEAQPEFTPAHVMLARAYAKLKRTDLFRREQGIIRRLNEEQQERDLSGVDQLYDGKVLALPSKGPDRRSPAQPRK